MMLKFWKSAFLRPSIFTVFVMLIAAHMMGQTPTGNVVITSNTTWAAGTYNLTSLTVQGGAALTVGGGSTVTVTSAITVTGSSSIILQSVNNTAKVNGAWVGAGVTLNAASVQVDSGSSINADGQGYAVLAGPGAGPAGTTNGGSYGGLGGQQAATTIYGSATAPVDLGSGGGQYQGQGGPGGGAINLLVSGTLTNNGVISANGGAVSGFVGGGSGGSVYVTANTLSGAGSFTANGGANSTTYGDGGGGGRVAVYSASASGFTGFSSSTATGGAVGQPVNSSPGAVGTVVFFDTSATNSNVSVYQDYVIPANTTVQYNSLTVENGAVLTIGGGSTVTVAGAIKVTGNSTMILQSINNTAQVNGTWQGAGVILSAASVEVDSGSTINADGQGYAPLAGPGAGTVGTGNGGSYGGAGGGQLLTTVYGSGTAPVDLGSGGAVYQGVAGPGGGAIKLLVSGTLTNNGVISANGGAVSGFVGGGSGGSVYVTANTLSGAGSFTANGGANSTTYGDGGGGGRVAVYSASASGFTGFTSSTATGGTVGLPVSSSPGANGTAMFFDTSAPNGNVSVYQDYVIPANTTVQYNSLTVENGALVTIGGGSTVTVAGAITVTGNSNIIVQSINNTAQVNGKWVGAGVTLNAGSVQVDSGSTINADGQGYAALAGPGAGTLGTTNGGSYGGLGGQQAATTIYGSAAAPVDLGSGGAQYQATPGAGGGAIKMVVSGTLTNNGIISANGGAESGNGFAGGGSGGSIYITSATLSGAGVFSAAGGPNPSLYGDGGGGGRMALYAANSSGFTGFTGFTALTAAGGTVLNTSSGGSPGAVGSVVFFDTSVTNSRMTVYANFSLPAGTAATYDAVTVQPGALLTIGGGSTVAVVNALSVSGTIVAQSASNTAQVNGTWQGSGLTLSAASVQINTGGVLNVDGQGYVQGAGPGGAPGGSSAGGSYGGLGGASNGVSPVPTYGSSTAPVDLGSGGGSRCCGTTGGSGGGLLTLTVSGTLTDNGIISANGGNATGFQAGGGSGGTVSIHTATLAGSGSIAANGGAGGEAGGGGGRISLLYNTNSGFNLALATANGGSGNGGNPGTTGTVYSLVGGTGLTVSSNMVLPANSNLTFDTVTVNNQGTLTLGSGSTVTANNIAVSSGGAFTVGGGSTVTINGPLAVTGNSNVILQSIHNTAPVSGIWSGAGVSLIAGSVQVDAGSSINADGQGYVAGAGPGGSPVGSSAGGSYGGLGGASNGVSPAGTYGSATAPMDLGSGGNTRCCGAGAGAGGGALRLIINGTLTDNGVISANGGNVVGLQAGGGSGGSVFMLVAGNLTGSGSIEANGGAGGEAGGGGGRVAVYYLTDTGFNPKSIVAAGGPNGTAGAAGTVNGVNGPDSVFLQPTKSVIHGTATIQWFTDIGGSSTVTLAGPQTATVATTTSNLSTSTFDTTQVPDGAYQLVLTVTNSAGQVAQQVVKNVVINNSVAWHSGTLTANETWTPSQVQALDGDVIVPTGVTLTILPGTVVKALAGSQIIVQGGGTLIATGNATAPVTFTTFDDFTIGGDTSFNAGVSLPSPGEWSGISVQAGTFNSNSNTIIRYAQATLSGTLGASTTLLATQVYTVNGTLVVPAGVTLTIQPGTILKFTSGAGMDVQPGATLTANGTLAQPIYFTSINDISIGGDTNGTGESIAPAPGDWDSIILDGATVSMQHVQIQYGGGPLNFTQQVGMIETTDNAKVTISDSVLAYAYVIGIQTGYPNGGGDTVTVTDTTFYGIEDRAINAFSGSTVHVVNDTIDGNAAGVFAHGGSIDVENSIISNTLGTQFGGIEVCCGGVFTALLNNDVYTTAKGVGNYVGLTDPTGSNGNISADPVYMNGTLHDYRPTYGSPAIDAASGTVANYPLTDAFGLARYNDPLVTKKTGTPDVNGKYPDMGAFEFVQTAPSNLDLTVSNVQGPGTAMVGTPVQVNWTVTNIGSGTAYGPWHDAVYLVTDPDTNPVATYAGTALEGAGIILGPGASYNGTTTVTVPGTTVGPHRWEVRTNVLGEIFEGANSANNTGIGLDQVDVDLAQLVPAAAPLTGSFPGVGQSAFYKVIPDTTETTKVQLALNQGVAGSVQLFVGAGYVPSPQHFDFQQVEYNSTSASVVIPSGSTQIYYVTAYAQTLPVSPAAYSIQASTVQFSLTTVTPQTVVASGTATITFIGGGFNSTTTFSLVGANGTTYSGTSAFLSDSDHADVTFAVGQIPAGTYTAQAVNGSTVTLANAVTLTSNTVILGPATSNVQVSLQTPEAFRAGFPSVVTLNYTNTSGDDIPAPLIYVAAGNATLTEVPPPCSGCSANYVQQYGATFNSGLVLGISHEGPAGILPAGASGSIQFYATPSSTGTVTFYASPAGVDPLATQLTLAQNLCHQTTGIVSVVCFFNASPVGAYQSAASLCASLTPVGTDIEGQQRACMLLLNSAGYTYTQSNIQNGMLGPQSDMGQFINGHVTFAAFNALLAADATALSAQGNYEYDASKVLAFELQKDGLQQLAARYHQGALGFGLSHPFDVTLKNNIVTYPDGTGRSFPTPSPTQPNVFLGLVGDYGTLTLETGGSYLLTESDGRLLHFAAVGGGYQFDYLQDRDGNRITFTYTNNLLTSAADSFGNKIAFTYDALGHITQFTDPEGRVTTYTYDTLNDTIHSTFLKSITDTAGTTNITWNEGGPSGVGYFADSCIMTYCEPSIGITSIAYPDGTHANFTYDAAGRVTSISRDGGAQAASFTYNTDGTTSLTDALGKVTQLASNQNAELASITLPLGSTTRLRYDPEGKIVGVQGALGDSIYGTYDQLSDLASVTSATGGLATIGYAGDRLPVSFTDLDGSASGFSYDSGYDLIAQSYPNESQTKYTYNAQGLPLTMTNRRGNTITFTYTQQGLPATKTYSNGSQVTYTYDSHNNLTSTTAPVGVTKYTYDSADRVLSETNPDGTSLQITYNANGQRSSLTDSTGFITNYTYDAVGRLASLTNASGAPIVSYAYDANGQLITKTFGNGTSTSLSHDANGNITSVINYSPSKAILSEYDYTFDNENQPVTMKAPNGKFSYTYDLEGQLTSVTTPTGSIQYAYDASGNRTSVTTNGVPSNYEPNNLNEYQVANNVPYQYDADGNLISGNGVSYTYDDEGKMLTMASATDTWSFQYDGLNNRIASVHNGTATHYLIDPTSNGNIEAELSGTGAVLAHYIYGVGLTSAVQPGGAADYYHFDGSGNTEQISNASGTVVNSYTYLPFGEQTVVAAGVNNPFTYNGLHGAITDGSGLYFMRNRTYNATIGRFQQQDPLGLEADLNLYRYANNSPVEYSDPTGLTALDDFTYQTSDSSAAHFLNGSSGFSNNPVVSGVASAVGSIGSIASAAQNAANGNTAYAIHDVTLAVLGVISNALPTPKEPPPLTPATVLYYIVKYAGTIDEVSQNVLDTYYNNQQQDNPFTKQPPNPCGSCITTPIPPQTVLVNSSIDPNGKLTSGYGNSGYVPAGAPIIYTVYFENQSTATLPAQKVTVTDPLASNLDWSTVQFNQISFNNVTLDTPTTTQNYTTQATVSTDPNPVAVSAAVNPSTGVITWTMQSVDPVTGAAPANPLAGFLPPNNAANAGSGYVTFSVMPKAGLTNGTTITNQASIVFDANAPISTNTVSNALDTSSVTSAINPMPATTTSTALNISWTGTDPSGSGIASYNIYVSIDGGAFSLWLSATTLTSSTYNALPGHSYSFASLATNNVGISQATPATPQTIAVTFIAPTITVTPAASNITAAQPLVVTIAVASPVGGTAVPTGTVSLTSGTYASAAATLSGGGTTITIPAGALANGADTLTVAYSPDSAASAIYGSATGTAQVTVGAGVAPAPIATLSPATLTFTAINGTTGAAQTAQLANTGNAPLTISAITITGAGATSFTQTNTCGTSLAVGSNCTLSVTFTPASIATFNASVSIADNAAGSPQTLALTGTGTAAPTFQLSATPVSQSVTAGGSVTYTINVKPQGGAFTSAVALTTSGLPAGDTAIFTPASVTPGSATVTSTLTIQTGTTIAGLHAFHSRSTQPLLALVGFLILVTRKRRHLRLLSVLVVASLVAITSLTGCGSSPRTANYTVTVTATSGSLVQTADVTLTVHQ